MLTTAAALNARGVTDIDSSAKAAEALRPLAGQFAFLLFAMGCPHASPPWLTRLGWAAAAAMALAVVALAISTLSGMVSPA